MVGMTVIRNGVTLEQRRAFSVSANNGCIVHLALSSLGQQLLGQRRQLPVEEIVSQHRGPVASKVVALVRLST